MNGVEYLKIKDPKVHLVMPTWEIGFVVMPPLGIFFLEVIL